MSPALNGISSMATRRVLADLARAYSQQHGVTVAIEAVGGVDAARRVANGEAFDVVLLASDALDKLIAAGHVLPGRVDLVHSPVAVAVQAGGARPDISSEAALQAALQAAPSIGYSTGPSGTFLTQLFARWGLADELTARTVQAQPGVPVGQLVASGEVALGFQQLSELMNLPGIDLLGVLPAGCAFITTFSGGVAASCTQPQAARELLAYFNRPESAEVKRRHGMTPASN